MPTDSLLSYDELTHSSTNVEIPVDQKPLDRFTVDTLVVERLDLNRIYRIEEVNEDKAIARLIGRMMSGGRFLNLEDPTRKVVNLTDPSWYIPVQLSPNF